jgi:hypothetical protein
MVPISNPTVYDFGNLLDNPDCFVKKSFAGNPFASLQMGNLGGGVWEFLLNINGPFSTNFGSRAFIGSMTFQLNPDPPGKVSTTASLIASNGVGEVKATTGTGNSSNTFDADFGTALGGALISSLKMNGLNGQFPV